MQAARVLSLSREPTATRDDVRAIVAQWAELYPDVFATSSGDVLVSPDADLIDLGPAVEIAEHPGREPATRRRPRPWRIAVAALLTITAAVVALIALTDGPAVIVHDLRPAPPRIEPALASIDAAPTLDLELPVQQPAELHEDTAEKPDNDGSGPDARSRAARGERG